MPLVSPLALIRPLFALAVAISMVVVYDATGIRRQAGMHAALINAMIRDLASGHPLKQEQLREVLGHTPMEVVGGLFLGIVIAQIWVSGIRSGRNKFRDNY